MRAAFSGGTSRPSLWTLTAIETQLNADFENEGTKKMKIPVNINITTERLTDGSSYGADGAETERIESSTSGFMKKTGGMLQLQYVEAESSGFGGTKTTVSLCGDMVAVNRSGQLNTHMIFEAGKSHDCVYDTGYFPMQLRVSTKSLDCDITELGGKLNIDYTVEIVGNVAEQSKLTLSVAPDSSVMTS